MEFDGKRPIGPKKHTDTKASNWEWGKENSTSITKWMEAKLIDKNIINSRAARFPVFCITFVLIAHHRLEHWRVEMCSVSFLSFFLSFYFYFYTIFRIGYKSIICATNGEQADCKNQHTRQSVKQRSTLSRFQMPNRSSVFFEHLYRWQRQLHRQTARQADRQREWDFHLSSPNRRFTISIQIKNVN